MFARRVACHVGSIIDAARLHVDLLVYIFAEDAVGLRVITALGEAVARGVRSRIMFDPVGSRRWRRGTRKLLDASGAKFREALPVGFLWRSVRDRETSQL